jgi:ribulose-5-phosphate 4-epimerase/fuculose-1-phosphate aldolase
LFPSPFLVAELVSERVKDETAALLLQHHGIVGLGKNLEEALSIVEAIEGLASTQFIATLLAKKTPSAPKEVLEALKSIIGGE